MIKRCIFHIPYTLSGRSASGSSIRPQRMLEAFQNIGYKVSVVLGNSAQRKKQIADIKNDMEKGIQFDFVYSEASTMPTLLTDSHHLPFHPLLDFSFLKLCKHRGIPIGLFYRDIYWKFPIYTASVGRFRAAIARLFYQYDIKQYEHLLTTFYVPTRGVSDLIQSPRLSRIVRELPPGAPRNVVVDYDNVARLPRPLHLLYVGGLGNQYDISYVLDTVVANSNYELTICTRENDWLSWASSHPDISQCSRIHIVHTSGNGLEPLYKNADICLLFLKPHPYLKIAVPVKLMEYLGHGIPIIETEGSAGSDIVSKFSIGWVIPYTKLALQSLLLQLLNDPSEIVFARRHCLDAIEENTWESRARQVAYDLGVQL